MEANFKITTDNRVARPNCIAVFNYHHANEIENVHWKYEKLESIRYETLKGVWKLKTLKK